MEDTATVTLTVEELVLLTRVFLGARETHLGPFAGAGATDFLAREAYPASEFEALMASISRKLRAASLEAVGRSA